MENIDRLYSVFEM